ncbi:sugar ABC transporter permease [Streptomyces alkaliterrae]|uniref:ABC transporter permease subunit n=1 Tax=Streptomyces alkaliterrae TaxID=2213162 RepID=A0A5P0YP59_9ACTN|nr:carbohydrate ABC transporter permease [Streptomyces alkaliterrae]MBB1260417.1 carbohydrate ABC transporter permease [Streptomyces alkaliterrae]MQS02144.1 ABC transporter permease subunit [Streptomyces alkaliterrae]
MNPRQTAQAPAATGPAATTEGPTVPPAATASPAPTAAGTPAVPPRRPRRNDGGGLRDRRGPLASLGLHLGLIVAAVIAVFPPLWLVVTSFKPKTDAFTLDIVKNFTFENYKHVLADTHFLDWFGNSVVVVLGTTVLGVLISSTTGYALSRFRFPGMRPLMWTLLITQMFPMAVLIVPLYNLMATLGLLNQPVGLIVTYLTIAVPFCAWMMKGFFDTIPVSIDESGRVDGLTPFGTFWRLVMPLAKPGLAVTGFYTFVTAWAEVAYATAFMTGEENLTLAGGLQTFVNQYSADWGSMTAAAVIIAVPAALVFGFAQRYLVSGMTAGAVKS